MKVLDLFSGLRGWSDPWKERGHEVLAIDLDTRFGADFHIDLGDTQSALEHIACGPYSDPYVDVTVFGDLNKRYLVGNSHVVTGGWRPDVILASPPCNSFSTMVMGRMWTHDGQPKHPIAVEGQRLVLSTLRIIATLQPRFWIIENPRARLRSLPLLEGIPRRTVTYCRYGEERMKPTDLWGVFPRSWIPREMCHNGNSDHIAAPRGSRSGTQGGVDSARSGLIPRELSLELCLAVERDTNA